MVNFWIKNILYNDAYIMPFKNKPLLNCWRKTRLFLYLSLAFPAHLTNQSFLHPQIMCLSCSHSTYVICSFILHSLVIMFYIPWWFCYTKYSIAPDINWWVASALLFKIPRKRHWSLFYVITTYHFQLFKGEKIKKILKICFNMSPPKP